jgi:hypothetical protein
VYQLTQLMSECFVLAKLSNRLILLSEIMTRQRKCDGAATLRYCPTICIGAAPEILMHCVALRHLWVEYIITRRFEVVVGRVAQSV